MTLGDIEKKHVPTTVPAGSGQSGQNGTLPCPDGSLPPAGRTDRGTAPPHRCRRGGAKVPNRERNFPRTVHQYYGYRRRTDTGGVIN